MKERITAQLLELESSNEIIGILMDKVGTGEIMPEEAKMRASELLTSIKEALKNITKDIIL